MSHAHAVPPLPAVRPAAKPRLQLVRPATATATAEVAEEVRRGLTSRRKKLSPWLFYDARGSELFDAITQLPEYYLTRAERSIFAQHADDIVGFAKAGSALPLHILELGAGTAAKTGLLLSAAVRAQGKVIYQPLDVSASALELAQRNLQRELPGVTVEAHTTDYTRGYDGVTRPAGPRLALFIGSSIGNFEPRDAVAVLRQLRGQLVKGDSLLLGIDLRKDPAILLAAYNDAAGVTAAFNKNVLARINRELGADFDLKAFAHEARWNSRLSRIEMHLVSLRRQHVRLAGLGLELDFREGESIHTENSYKYSPRRVKSLLAASGFGQPMFLRDQQGRFLTACCKISAPNRK
jgi:L-histidine N-alpha-methyltransferase